MATRTISTKLAIEGESEYKQALSSVASQLTTLDTKLKLVESEYTNNQNSMEALQAKAEALANKHDALAQKVETCKEAYANAKTQLENYQAKTESLQTSLEQNQAAQANLSDETKEAGTQWAEYKTKLEDAESKLAELQNTSGDTSDEEEKLNKTIKECKEQMANLEDSTDGAAKTAGELQLEEKDLNKQLSDNEAYTKAAQKGVDSWETQCDKAQIQLNKLDAEIEDNEKYLDEASKSSDGCATSIDQYGKKVSTADTNTGKFNKTMDTMTAMMVAGQLKKAFDKLASAIMDCVDAAADFEEQMSTVQALSGATSSEMDELTAAAKEMGATTSFTATEAGEALEYMALAGWDTDEMLDALAPVMNLAAAAGEDLATTSDIVTDAITAFGYSASDTAEFADVLAAASANSNTTVSELGEAFKQMGTTAGTLNYSIEDVADALGLMANNGLKGESAGTALATALTRMAGSNSSATTQLEEWNISMFDAEGNAKDLNEFLMELRDAFYENCDGEDEMTVAAYNLAGQKGMKGLLAIVNSTDEDIDSLSESIEYCSGAAEDMAQTKLDNYAGQVTLLESAWDALKVTVGEELTPALGGMVEKLTDIINKLNDTLENNPAIIDAFAALTVGLGSMTAALTVATVAKKAFDLVMNSVSGVGLLVTAIVGAAAALGTFIALMAQASDTVKEARQANEDLADSLDETETSYEEAAEAAATSNASLDSLMSRYTELSEKTSLTTSEQAELDEIMKELNNSVDGLSLAYDEETGAVNMTTEALGEMVGAQEATNELTAAQQYQEEAAQNLWQAEQNVADINEKLADSEDLTNREVKQLTEAQEEANEQLEQAQADFDAAAEACAEATEALEQFNTIEEESDQVDIRVTDTVNNMAERMIALEDEYDEVYTSAYDSLSGQFDLWDKVDEVATISMSDLWDALESQEKYWEEYEANMELLTNSGIEGMDELLASFDTTSTDGVIMVASLAQGLEENADDLQAYVTEATSTMPNIYESAAEATAKGVTDIEGKVSSAVADCIADIEELDLGDEAKQDALNTLQGYVNGLDEETGEVDEEARQVAQELIDYFAEELGINSPSTVFRDFGANTMQGYINGVDESTEDVSG
ncbi:MAG: phage tail tape measure protein, partial [Coriobacteriaceae bacterium]|nr:phage tail tape measure protein [Coriobacteriaceae bacterium]